MSEKCISLAESTECSAFAEASISTSGSLIDYYSFLAYVSNTEDFDKHIQSYVKSEYVKKKYENQLGCTDINLQNTTSLYARYTTSVICNGIVQNSREPCDLSDEQSRPLCADTCALAATSEEMVAVNEDLCGSPKEDFMDQIRSDFTVCSNPADSLTGSCISGDDNEPDECGFGTNLLGLCDFCSESSPNSTDSCCIASDSTGRCEGLTLPTFTSMPPLFPSETSSSTPSASSTDEASAAAGLSGGEIAGVVVGSVVGLVLLGALAFFLIWRRRRRDSEGSIFNQPTPPRQSPTGMQHAHGTRGKQGAYEVLGGGRVARMSALQGGNASRKTGSSKYNDSSDSEAFGESPIALSKRSPPVASRRHGSLSSTSVLGATGATTPPKSGSIAQFSSPEGVASGQSEQLPYFRDYYSPEDIHPNDKVSALWAYQPRAGDEFELERGDMLKVVGIWDDGWATGVRINERAEDYDGKHNAQRDSGVSNGTSGRDSSPPPAGEIKAFPLVCVCAPEHWRKTVDGHESHFDFDD